MDAENSDKDLPLMANVNDILVNHYVFELFCSFELCSLSGFVIMELLPSTNHCAMCSWKVSEDTKICDKLKTEDLNCENCLKPKDFVFVLDCSNINVTGVEEIVVDCSVFSKFKFCNANFEFTEISKLNFTSDKWSLKISKPGVFCCCHFPRIVKINYQTKPEGQSLMWVTDQDNRPAVYTYGAWINNRSLYPCQEPPTAMATWEAHISVAEPAAVLMSGDQTPLITTSEGVISYYYKTEMKLPLSTLALAVGYWDVVDQFNGSSNTNTSIRVCASPSILSKCVKELSNYSISCLKAAETLLGPYPFPRVDFLVVPRGFNSLGMASPNIIFLSQSVLSSKHSNQSMYCRVAHEIAHAWFGLIIGALDWTEEWLSEGFATFMEDLIHTRALGMAPSEAQQYSDVKAHFRFKTLMAEIENTEQELQVLRPNKGEIQMGIVDGVDAVILKNGQNTEKAFMQIHYIKGYFLLKYLCDLVGLPAFLKFLNLYITKYKGQLVESTEMLAFFIETFSETSANGITVEKIVSDWLHTTGIPEVVVPPKLALTNPVYMAAMTETKKWRALNAKLLKRNPKRKRYDFSNFSSLPTEELLIVLDALLDEEKVASVILKHLSQFYDLENRDAEIRHKWCELVIKHRYSPGYVCVKNFLMNDLAMGVYLYGELILNGTPTQKLLAEDCFKSVHNEMEPNCVVTVQQMLDTAASASVS